MRFKGAVDLRQGMDFAGIVKIVHKGVSEEHLGLCQILRLSSSPSPLPQIDVYPADYPQKPPVGEGLNRPAVVTLFEVFPTDRTTGEPVKDPAKLDSYAEKVRVAVEVAPQSPQLTPRNLCLLSSISAGQGEHAPIGCRVCQLQQGHRHLDL